MTVMTEYRYNSGDRHDPRWYENQPNQCSVETASIWTLHINYTAGELDRVRRAVADLPEITGEYTAGDSWAEWGETTPRDPHDQHFALYFRANPANVDDIHLAMTKMIETKLGALEVTYVSAAGDWAEQRANSNTLKERK